MSMCVSTHPKLKRLIPRQKPLYVYVCVYTPETQER
jgi:hypothetical protein